MAHKKNKNLGVYLDAPRHKLVYQAEEFEIDICDELGITSIVKNLNTQVMVINFYHKTICTNGHFQGTLSDLQKSKVVKFLAEKGVVIDETYSTSLVGYLKKLISDNMNEGKLTYIHDKVGWAIDGSTSSGYLASKSIGSPYQSVIRDNERKIIGSKGNRQIYDNMISNEVIPNKNLHIPLVLAFTAPLVPLLESETNCPVLVTNFAGKSSQGKTTSLSLIASIWGCGTASNSRLSIMRTFSSTQNAFEAAINSNNGFPVIFDDYESSQGGINFSTLMYTLAQGESKSRCGKGGKAVDTFSWRTFIGLSGESSIFNRTNKNMGLKARIVEFKNKKWTTSKNNSINITKVVSKHYGFYGEEFIWELLKKSNEYLIEKYNESNSIICSKIPPKDSISDRIQTRLAIIRTTAVLVKELMNLEIDVDYVTDFLVNNEISRQKAPDTYESAKEDVISYLNANYTSFVRFDIASASNIIPNKSILGKIYKGNQGMLIALTKRSMNSIMEKYNDREAIFDKWREEKFLITDKDGRYTKKVRLQKGFPPDACYTFSFDSLTEIYSQIIDKEVIEMGDLDVQDLLDRTDKGSVRYIGGQKYIPIPKVEPGDTVITSPNKSFIREETAVKVYNEETSQLTEITYPECNDINQLFGE